MIWEIRSTASEDTERLGEVIGQLLPAPACVELHSDLGGGKTTFVRGLVRGLGSKDTVSSPTFTISKVYKAKDKQIQHFDFYRLAEAGIIKDQLQEALDDKDTIIVVEWAGIIANVLPEERLSIKLEPVANDTDERVIKISYPEIYTDLIRDAETRWKQVRP